MNGLRVVAWTLMFLSASQMAAASGLSSPVTITNYFTGTHTAAYLRISSAFNPDGCAAPDMRHRHERRELQDGVVDSPVGICSRLIREREPGRLREWKAAGSGGRRSSNLVRHSRCGELGNEEACRNGLNGDRHQRRITAGTGRVHAGQQLAGARQSNLYE